MLRRILAAVACLVWAVGVLGSRAQAAPLLYVYEGAGCTAVANLPRVQAFLGRPVDGVIDFNDYTQTRANAALNADWDLGCWQGQAPNIAYAIGLAFSDTTTAQVAAGVADAQYAHMAASLVSHGFPHAYVRLGWEMNGGWYPWGQKGATFAAAFNHVAPIIKAGCPGCTLVFNPAMDADPSSEAPGSTNIGAMGLDVYATSWIGAVQTEPALWTANLTGWQGVGTAGAPYTTLPVVIPEFGVGSEADGHGACAATTATACDDGVYMADALADFEKIGAVFVGYWDQNNAYNSQISAGARPHEALAFVKVFGSPAMNAIFTAYATAFTDATPPTLTVTNCHAVAFQNGPSHWEIVVWAQAAHPSARVSWTGKTTNANVYDPAAAKPTTPVQALGASNAWTGVLTAGQPLVIAVAQ